MLLYVAAADLKEVKLLSRLVLLNYVHTVASYPHAHEHMHQRISSHSSPGRVSLC